MLASDAFGKLADLARELARASFIHKSGQRRTQAGALTGNPRTDQEAEYCQSDQKHEVNDCDCPVAAVDHFFQAQDGGVNKVGE